MSELRTPAEWEKVDGIVVIDPDGWRRDGRSWDDAISRDEWERRKFVSTISGGLPRRGTGEGNHEQ